MKIFKSGTNEICAQKHMRNKQTPPTHLCHLLNKRVFTFSFVRDPLAHFVSGYSEITVRAGASHKQAAHKCLKRGCFHWLRENDPDKRARAFVADYIHGRATNHTCCPKWDAPLHVVPQAAFLRSALDGRYKCHVHEMNYIGRLENMTSDWARMNKAVGVSDHSAFGTYAQQSKSYGHPTTSGTSGNKWRVAMDRLLQDDSQLSASTRDALCTILNVDNVCFGYPVRKVCAHANVADIKCPVAFDASK